MIRLFLTILFLSGCTTITLAPSEVRRAVFRTETNGQFSDVKLWAAKTFVNSNHAVQLVDEETRTLVAKARRNCTALKMGNGFAKEEVADFTLIIHLSDGTIKAEFSNIVMDSGGTWDSGFRPSNEDEVREITVQCLEPIFNSLTHAMRGE